MTDDIENTIRNAKPGTSHRTDPVSEKGLRLLQSIRSMNPQQQSRDHRPKRHRQRLLGRTGMTLVTGTTAVLFVIAAVMVNILQTMAPVHAATPELLHITAAPETIAEVTEELSRGHTHSPESPPTTNTLRLTEWSLHSLVNDKGEIESSEIEPQWRELTFLADGTTRFRILAGESFAGQDASKLPRPGTILEDTTYDATNPFEHSSTYAKEPPTDAALMNDYLATTIGVEIPTTAEYFKAITGLLSNRLITAEQEFALLEFIATLPNIELDGTTTDRLDRRGVVVRVTEKDYAHLLVLSPQTGKFLAAETIYIGSSRTDIPSPAVTSYIAWER